MAAGIKHNAYQVAHRIEARGPAVEREVTGALDVQGQKLTRVMKGKAAKFRSELANSIHMETPSQFERVIAPGVAHGALVERGIKPGGKGLPRYFDTSNAPIVAWLQTKLGGLPKSKRKRPTFELALRDAYEGLAWHIRHFGVKAQPFVKPTFDENVAGVTQALRLAVARGMAADGTAGGAA